LCDIKNIIPMKYFSLLVVILIKYVEDTICKEEEAKIHAYS